MKLLAVALCVAVLVQSCYGDLYMHRMRSSNNRLNEDSADRDNGDRLFDSQNNNRGGYNVGEKMTTPFPQGTDPNLADQGPDATYAFADGNPSSTATMQYQEVFYEGSILQIEWTNQHACGGNDETDPQKINCNIVGQFMCDTDTTGASTSLLATDPALIVSLRDGQNTNTPDEPTSYTDVPSDNAATGHHESESYYYECARRSRNYNLFHADQQLQGPYAIFTRQDNNGDRQGLECTEERDYYPYWGPTPWIDIFYLTDDISRCPLILEGSQNTATTYKCTSSGTGVVPTDDQLFPITEEACNTANGFWRAIPPKGVAAPICQQVDWSRDNHLGNGRYGQPLSFNWTLPTISTLKYANLWGTLIPGFVKCAFRLRYNISTDDYNPWAINSTADDNPTTGVVSPVQQNPAVDVGADLQGLRLAINTAQFGRTFQDRSHVFYIRPRPTAFAEPQTIINLSVRGKRGNIVQTYPAVEYDFVPNRLELDTSTLLHIQWTGSNTHNNGNPGGDGQTGDAGEGTDGTDRHNFVQMLNLADNYPIPLDMPMFATTNIFASSSCWDLNASPLTPLDCAVVLATSGQFRSAADAEASTTNFDPQLNDAPASLIGGIVLQINVPGTYNYMCTRNNSFSNRSQKGTLIVS